MASLELTCYRSVMRAELVTLLNEAYADVRGLPAVGVERPDYPHFTEEQLVAREAEGCEIVLVRDAGRIVSAASWRAIIPESYGVIDFIATRPECRRAGHARTLLAECENWARRIGLRHLQTGPFVDSRLEPACSLFEACGFQVRDPMHMNTTWAIDIGKWTPRDPVVPSGYRVVTFGPGDEVTWCELHRSIFGSSVTPEWFVGRFGGLPNFDPNGWFFVERGRQKVGMAGAIVWFHDDSLTQPSGALVEWVGVLEEERGKHLGEALMVACLNYLKRRAVEPNCIVTQYARKAAVSLYKKLGYRFVRECRTYLKPLL